MPDIYEKMGVLMNTARQVVEHLESGPNQDRTLAMDDLICRAPAVVAR